MNTDAIVKTKEDNNPPNIFNAAQNNDVAELLAALADGQRLDEQSAMFLMMTPVHVAAGRHSNEFLGAASQHESFNPWLRDDNMRVAIDHATATNNVRGHGILHETMYAVLDDQDHSIDYSDNEPSPFFP
ncbi:hypothetical protein [Primorskyibacter flagellatus]|uniref:Uncharacterized protein n=1 Tax=Primorskyibacter flagellatus TaxID=1387277 RepID=A0A1W2E628_9RHOB|nr:hypothetical protein [Primorskyibacter flagellatus]SMD04508.1 hypothetical protein SAMN06295998_1226 [Primorskyibacter flagellatus]